MPEAFDVSARLFEIPPQEMAVWKELGRYVAVFQRGQGVVHFLSAAESRAECGRSVGDSGPRIVPGSTRVHSTASRVPRVDACRGCFHQHAEGGARSARAHRGETRATPSQGACGPGCRPEAGRLREERASRKRMAGYIALACLAYVLFFGGLDRAALLP